MIRQGGHVGMIRQGEAWGRGDGGMTTFAYELSITDYR